MSIRCDHRILSSHVIPKMWGPEGQGDVCVTTGRQGTNASMSRTPQSLDWVLKTGSQSLRSHRGESRRGKSARERHRACRPLTRRPCWMGSITSKRVAQARSRAASKFRKPNALGVSRAQFNRVISVFSSFYLKSVL